MAEMWALLAGIVIGSGLFSIRKATVPFKPTRRHGKVPTKCLRKFGEEGKGAYK